MPLLLSLSLLIFISCSSRIDSEITYSVKDETSDAPITFFYGADLSYANEMEDCGATYKDSENKVKDVYGIFKDEGANLVRLRLWHHPTWTDYSNLEDVKKSIQRAKNNGLKILLDFHYSDTWADPGHQQIPEAWLSEIGNTTELAQLLYQYTYDVLKELDGENLTPDIVQIGNEINPMILQDGPIVWPIDWTRNAALINKGIKAVRDISNDTDKTIEVMLHIAQPENGLWWFEEATQNGITDFDWIGLSYYPEHSEYTLETIGDAVSELISVHNRKLMIVETGYPYTLDDIDSANNILDTSSLISGIPASNQGQLDFLNQLTSKIKDAGGSGIVYWEPSWVSTNCNTLWAKGSHWDNATMFDNNGKINLGIQFYNQSLNE